MVVLDVVGVLFFVVVDEEVDDVLDGVALVVLDVLDVVAGVGEDG